MKPPKQHANLEFWQNENSLKIQKGHTDTKYTRNALDFPVTKRFYRQALESIFIGNNPIGLKYTTFK